MKNRKKALQRMVQTSLFIALCFVGTLVSIPFGASKVHLGNLLCLLAGLLCGPWVGGISGGVGMLFADLASGYPYTTYLRTFVLKFSMGFLIGWLYRLLLKKDVKGTGLLFAGAVVSPLLFGGGLSFYLLKPEDPYGLPLLILSSVLFGFFLAAVCFLKKLDPSKKILLFSLLCALGANVVGEFFLRFGINLLLGMGTEEAWIVSLSKLPAALLTSIVSILGALLLFYPLYRATARFNPLDDLAPYLMLNKKQGFERE